jgi:hypothetical protein
MSRRRRGHASFVPRASKNRFGGVGRRRFASATRSGARARRPHRLAGVIRPRAASRITCSTCLTSPSTRWRAPPRTVISVIEFMTPRRQGTNDERSGCRPWALAAAGLVALALRTALRWLGRSPPGRRQTPARRLGVQSVLRSFGVVVGLTLGSSASVPFGLGLIGAP